MNKHLEKKLKLIHLRLILAIDTHRQISLAAAETGITQPAASRMLVELETMLGVSLFERHPRGMTPTSYGSTMVVHARRVILTLSDIDNELSEMRDGKAGTLSVGAETGTTLGLIIPAIQRLKRDSPKTKIVLDVDTSATLVSNLVNGHSDIALASMPLGVNTDSVDMYPLGTETVKLLVGEKHPLVQVPAISMHDLLDYDWIIQMKHSPIGEAVESAFRKSGTPTPRNLIRTSSYLAMIAYINSSTAITPVTDKVAEFLTNGTFGKSLRTLSLPEEIIASPYYLIQVKGRLLSPIARSLKNMLLGP